MSENESGGAPDRMDSSENSEVNDPKQEAGADAQETVQPESKGEADSETAVDQNASEPVQEPVSEPEPAPQQETELEPVGDTAGFEPEPETVSEAKSGAEEESEPEAEPEAEEEPEPEPEAEAGYDSEAEAEPEPEAEEEPEPKPASAEPDSRTNAAREWNKQTSGKGESKKKAKAKKHKVHRRRVRRNTHKHHAPSDVRRYAGTLIALAVVLVLCIIGFTPLSEKITLGLDIQGGVSVVMTASKPDGSAVTDSDMEKAVTIVQNRVNSLGASEATVQRQGTNSILVQIPGATDAEQAIETIGTTGFLEFVRVDQIADQDALLKINSGQEDVELAQGTYTAFMTGDDITNVTVSQEQGKSTYEVDITLNAEGTQKFAEVSAELAPTHGRIAIVLDGVVKSAPAVQSTISNGRVAITGNFTLDEAKSLQTVLDSGSLPVTLEYSESRVVGPTLGQDSLRQGLIAVVVGLICVAIYLTFFYQGLGFMISLGLVVFGIVYLGVLALLSHYGLFALSLPGIAGVVLTIGTATDSSVLVLERFREELRMGRNVRAASVSGSKHGINTAIDAGIVTLISALGLFFLSVGQVRGFGLTLALGVCCSFLTLLCYTTPMLRLLGRSQIEKHPGFWGVRHDIDEGRAAKTGVSALKGGVANA